MALVQSPPTSPSPYAAPSSFLPGPPSSRPSPLRRPSALRSRSSEQITPAVCRFDKRQPVVIPRSPGQQQQDEGSRTAPRKEEPGRSGKGVPRMRPAPPIPTGAAPAPAPRATLARSATLPTRPPPQPLSLNPSSSSSSSSSSGPSPGSLLARRRSSRSAVRSDILPLLKDLKLDELPPAPLEDLLDDTVRPAVIGESSAAVTPLVEEENAEGRKEQARVVVRPFKPTRSFVSTPFPKKANNYFSSDEEDEEDEEDEAKQEKSGVVGEKQKEEAVKA
ncbi:hypothetical protein JCM8547_001727 [Rhodosporidiobolus lusitaniae]